MMRGTWVYDQISGELVPKDEYYARRPAAKRGTVAMPMLIRDCIEVKSMTDGKTYTSKAALRRAYKAQGYIEVGNEEPKIAPPPKPDRKAIRNSIGKALNRVGLPTT